MIKKSKKTSIISKFKVHKTDTGSSAVQAAILSKKIDELVKHLKKNPKDNHSRRGLIHMVAKRRKLLDYLKKTDEKKYKTVIKKLKLKK